MGSELSFQVQVKANNAGSNKINFDSLKQELKKKDGTENISFVMSIGDGMANVKMFTVKEDGTITYGDGHADEELEFPNHIDLLDDEQYSLYKVVKSKY